MKRIFTALAAAGFLASGVAYASQPPAWSTHGDSAVTTVVPVQYERERWDDRSGDVREREARLRGWIQRGIDDGRIDRREARRLYRELGDIRAKERSYLSDGRLDGRERADLNRDLDRLADNVRDQMRDRR
jgi:hypothetical protein